MMVLEIHHLSLFGRPINFLLNGSLQHRIGRVLNFLVPLCENRQCPPCPITRSGLNVRSSFSYALIEGQNLRSVRPVHVAHFLVTRWMK